MLVINVGCKLSKAFSNVGTKQVQHPVERLNHQLLKVFYGMQLPDVPLWLIDTVTGKRFERDSDPKSKTHYLLPSPDGYGELRLFSSAREKQEVPPETCFRAVP